MVRRLLVIRLSCFQIITLMSTAFIQIDSSPLRPTQRKTCPNGGVLIFKITTFVDRREGYVLCLANAYCDANEAKFFTPKLKIRTFSAILENSNFSFSFNYTNDTDYILISDISKVRRLQKYIT